MRYAAAVVVALGVLLGGSPGWPQGTDWRYWRDVFLGPARVKLMTTCSLARDINDSGKSYWSPETRQRVEGMLIREFGEAHAQAFYAGQAAAMSVACPDVR